jgi:hypothetical protein
LIFKGVGAAVVGRNVIWLWEGYIMAKFWKVNIWRAAWEACNSTQLYKLVRTSGNMSRLRHEPNRLLVSIGLWRWYINVTSPRMNYKHRATAACRRI